MVCIIRVTLNRLFVAPNTKNLSLSLTNIQEFERKINPLKKIRYSEIDKMVVIVEKPRDFQ